MTTNSENVAANNDYWAAPLMENNNALLPANSAQGVSLFNLGSPAMEKEIADDEDDDEQEPDDTITTAKPLKVESVKKALDVKKDVLGVKKIPQTKNLNALFTG